MADSGSHSRVEVPASPGASPAVPKRKSLINRIRGSGSASAAGGSQREPVSDRVLPAEPPDGDKPIFANKPVNLDHRKRLLLILDNPKSGRLSRIVITTNVAMIIISVLAFFMNTVPSMRGTDAMFAIEMTCTGFFTVEVVLRTYCATLNLRKRLLLDANYWMDVLCIVPVYVELAMMDEWHDDDEAESELRAALKFLQLLRLVRLIKLFRHYTDYRVIIIALENSYKALLVPCFAMLMTVAMLGGALYLVEELYFGQPDEDTDAGVRTPSPPPPRAAHTRARTRRTVWGGGLRGHGPRPRLAGGHALTAVAARTSPWRGVVRSASATASTRCGASSGSSRPWATTATSARTTRAAS